MWRSLPVVLLVSLLTACSHPGAAGPSPAPPMPGADRAPHGCIGSAGYRWCARTAQCERPWELAKARQIDNSAAAFDAYCAAAPARHDGPGASR